MNTLENRTDVIEILRIGLSFLSILFSSLFRAKNLSPTILLLNPIYSKNFNVYDKMIKRFHLFLALLLVSVIPLAGGSTGKIKGNIIDNEGQQSLIGVNIYLDGTAIGTASDELGNYLIINVPAATYTVVVSYVG